MVSQILETLLASMTVEEKIAQLVLVKPYLNS